MDFGQIVKMFPLFYHLRFKPIVGSMKAERLKIYVQPVEAIAFDVFVLHTEIYFAVIIVFRVDIEVSVFVFEQVAQV